MSRNKRQILRNQSLSQKAISTNRLNRANHTNRLDQNAFRKSYVTLLRKALAP